MDFEHFRAEHTLDCDSTAFGAILNTFCTGIMMKITAKDQYIETAPMLICGFCGEWSQVLGNLPDEKVGEQHREGHDVPAPGAGCRAGRGEVSLQFTADL